MKESGPAAIVATSTRSDRDGSADELGVCPTCHAGVGPVNVGRVHWFYCKEHGVCWRAGENLFSAWREESEADWARNRELLADMRVVEPAWPMCSRQDGGRV